MNEAVVQAAMWYQKAADKGIAQAQVGLGKLYDEGHGVPLDHTQAAFWYQKAAEQGDAAAQYDLGLLTANGTGVPQDYVIAHMWFNLAASHSPAKSPYPTEANKHHDLASKAATRWPLGCRPLRSPRRSGWRAKSKPK